MKHWSVPALAGVALAAALSQGAIAADLPLKAAPMPAAAPVIPPVSGYVEAYTGGAWTKDHVDAFDTDLKFNGWALGGAGRANWWALPHLSVQLDAQAEGTQYRIPSTLLFVPGEQGHISTLSYLVAAHANWRDPQVGLLGGFAGIGDASGNFATGNFFNTGARHALGGLEGQLYWNAFTLYAQGGFDETVSMGNVATIDQVHQWFARLTGRAFATPNLMFEATGQYANGAVEHSNIFFLVPDTGFRTWTWRVKGEWRPMDWPVSLFVVYQGSQARFDNLVSFLGTEKVTDNRVMAGVRFYLGQPMGHATLFANDREGASLDILDPLGAPTSPLMLFPFGQEVAVSDARLKRDIVLLGRRDDGLGIYRYRYLWSDTVYVGVMAQEVALIHPEAVVHGLDGYLRVDYGRLGLHLMTLPQGS